MENENKNPLYSKTIWFGLITALAPFIMYFFNFDLGAIMANNAEAIGMIWGALAIILRLVTKDKIKLME